MQGRINLLLGQSIKADPRHETMNYESCGILLIRKKYVFFFLDNSTLTFKNKYCLVFLPSECLYRLEYLKNLYRIKTQKGGTFLDVHTKKPKKCFTLQNKIS